MKYCATFLLGLLLSGSVAAAHARPERSEPSVGSEVKQSPAEVRIWFDEEIQPVSEIQVLGSDGKEVDRKDTHVDAKDKRLLVVSLPRNLPVGTYLVKWRAMSVDSHRTHDEFKFVVKR
jgi:methionine-rich copper-binding protein CopC